MQTHQPLFIQKRFYIKILWINIFWSFQQKLSSIMNKHSNGFIFSSIKLICIDQKLPKLIFIWTKTCGQIEKWTGVYKNTTRFYIVLKLMNTYSYHFSVRRDSSKEVGKTSFVAQNGRSGSRADLKIFKYKTVEIFFF